MEVCIEKDPQGRFFVSVNNDSPATTDEPTATSDSAKRQPARNLAEALHLAEKYLSQPDQAGPSPFDTGLLRTMPNRQRGTGLPLG